MPLHYGGNDRGTGRSVFRRLASEIVGTDPLRDQPSSGERALLLLRADSGHVAAYPEWAKKLAQVLAGSRRTNWPARRRSASSVRSAHLRKKVLNTL